ncbi:carbonic anhydrase 4-like [Anabas testudineus]|uniref:Carbonic anhydrase n=1 Tax=Anabas testudineus TaxID=64144 RepID=A0A7N6AUR0_ANATE|nr:carbonic anhydrase 4-like [Anabas testudineus]XP_026207750.1 carbonic anhydrase 4-like [Anabas testudineus]
MQYLVVAVIAVCAVVPHTTESLEWCYNEPSCNDSTWSTIAPLYCNGSRQSPININSTSAKPDSNLTAFTFQNFNSTTAFQTMNNTDNTVRIILGSGVKISGGGLSESYDSLQFHLHWGNGSSVPGSEHTVDGKRYAMELHIVNVKSSYNRNMTLAAGDSTGIAALGFFIEAITDNTTKTPQSWSNLTSYLKNITNSGDSVAIAPGISLDDLLVGVDRTKYYRYLGSLTTPSCNEAVVWTVFKDSIKVNKDLIDLFSTTVHFSNSSSPFMTNVYRRTQPAQPVTTQPAATTTSSASRSLASTPYYFLGLMALGLTLRRN